VELPSLPAAALVVGLGIPAVLVAGLGIPAEMPRVSLGSHRAGEERALPGAPSSAPPDRRVHLSVREVGVRLGSSAGRRAVVLRAGRALCALPEADWKSSFPAEIIFWLGVSGRESCAGGRVGPGGAEEGPGGSRLRGAEPGEVGGQRGGLGAEEPCCWAGCGHPASPLSLLLGERHFAVDCNFIMSQVPNMPLANKRQSSHIPFPPLQPPENKHFPVFPVAWCTLLGSRRVLAL